MYDAYFYRVTGAAAAIGKYLFERSLVASLLMEPPGTAPLR